MNYFKRPRGLGPGNVQTWVGLHPETLQTPYAELCQMMRHLDPFQGHLVDLGAGYGRMALVLASFSPQSFFTGYELVKERVLEGQRVLQLLGLDHAKLLQQDLVDPEFELPIADTYFLYDYGKVAAVLLPTNIHGSRKSIRRFMKKIFLFIRWRSRTIIF